MIPSIDAGFASGAVVSYVAAGVLWLRHQWRHARHAPQVVSAGGEVGIGLCSLNPDEGTLVQPTDGFEPPEDLFNPFTIPLTESVARMPGGACVQTWGAPAVDAGNVGRNAVLAKVSDEGFGAVALIGTERGDRNALATPLVMRCSATRGSRSRGSVISRSVRRPARLSIGAWPPKLSFAGWPQPRRISFAFGSVVLLNGW
ncbi:MAG: hypothetical protein HONDAALG_03470 [Gammaproteobacteria bacterium]|nr:hypothetical protein [Gammaproteobacteria bacterium]